MIIRPTTLADLRAVMSIYQYAREFMQRNGNPNQWINGYPQEELIRSEITQGHSFVCIDQVGDVVATFCLLRGDDPTYAYIEQGAWLNSEPYATIHRLASNGTSKGVTDRIVAWCASICPNLRADTHSDNLIMQKLLERNGFERCGVIYVSNGTPRVAFQRCATR